MNVAQRDTEYKKLLRDSPFLFADGAGMALAAKILGTRLNNNLNGTDLFLPLCEAAARAGRSIYFLGAAPGVAETTNFNHIVRHYHYSHESINPHRIVLVNPELNWLEPHGRG